MSRPTRNVKYSTVAKAFLLAAFLTAVYICHVIVYLHSEMAPLSDFSLKSNDAMMPPIPRLVHEEEPNNNLDLHQLSQESVNNELNWEPLDRLINDETKPASIRILFKILKNHKPLGSFDEEIVDVQAETERCARYGFKYNSKQTHRRRIFFGSNIADDSWHMIGNHAAEAYGLYHTAVFVECNFTQSLFPRRLRFVDGAHDLDVLQSGIFGPGTDVQVGRYIVDNADEAPQSPLLFENMQREVILKHWKDSGMTIDDIGIVGDIDEYFSRDFMLAAQTCDVMKFRRNQNCKGPKIAGYAATFESSPNCIYNKTWHNNKPWTRSWTHPDMIIGECVDDIGDAELHSPPAERDYANGTLGFRLKGKGRRFGDWDKLPKRSKYPLWKPVDFRSANAGGQTPRKGKDKDNRHNAFHLHNFFDSLSTMRRKYSTYGHRRENVNELSLSQLQKDVDIMVTCVMNRESDAPEDFRYREGGLDAIIEGGGDAPILFRHPDYVNNLHHELKEEIIKDEAKYGNATYFSTNKF